MLDDYKTDKKLELWGEVFTQCSLPPNLTFERFIESPWEYLKQAGQEDAPSSICKGFSPLLPAQIEAKRNLESYWKTQGFDDASHDPIRNLERVLSDTDCEMDSLRPVLN